MTYNKEQSYEFPIVGGTQPADEYFVISVDSPAGPTTAKFKKLPFQRAEGYQATKIYGRVRGTDAVTGLPIVAPDITHYVVELYRDKYERREPFSCEVKNVPERPASEPYTVVDDNGIFFHVNEPEGLLSKGQKLLCRLTRLTNNYYSVALVNRPSRLLFYTIDTLLKESGVRRLLRPFIRRLLTVAPELEPARAEMTGGNARWLVTAAGIIMEHLPEWFLSSDLHKKTNAISALLHTFKAMILFLLEDSAYLNGMPGEQRRTLQHQLTEMADNLEPYQQTLRLIAAGQENDFIERMLEHLQKAGYLYHPARRFAVLMLIFRLQPDKVATYLSRIFESIFSRDLENWSREPFREAFLEQFQIYVRQARRAIDALPIAESREAKNNIENVITAIALQLLLANDDTNTARLWSLFYRYISLLRPINTDILLTKSFLSLLDAPINNRLTYEELKQPTMMMTSATVKLAGDDVLQRIEGIHRFTGSGVDVAISADGVVLSQQGRKDVTERAIPAGVMKWLRPQVMVNGIKSLTASKLKKLSEHSQWWHDIETTLFSNEDKRIAAPQRKPHPVVGDEMYIVIDGVLPGNSQNPTFTCHVQDDDYESVSGTLQRSQIVDYNLRQPSLRATRTDDGIQRGFYATVIADDTAGGAYRFSLRDTIDRFIAENVDYQTEYVAKIKQVSDRDYSAISNIGVGLFIERLDDDPEFSVGDMLRFRFTSIGKQGTLKGQFIEYTNDPADLIPSDAEAFDNLLTLIGENGDEEIVEEDVIDTCDLLTSDNIREIIEIIRFRAIAQTNLSEAYDYLRFARLLALAIGDRPLASKLLAHTQLLIQHQFFATNSRIDTDTLAKLAPEALADPFLKVIYHRLELVSWLGQTDHNADLYATSSNPSSELECSIASMVLAYNMLHGMQNGASESISSDIKNKIMEKLNVNNETRRGKYYGSESKYIEFKTSLVYPAVKPGEEMRENPDEQQRHILSRIAGFLNANGGQMFIGVNNDGYEVGMPDDFRYYERQKRIYVGPHAFPIANMDNLAVFLENLVNKVFGVKVARKVDISIDDEAEKGVIVIKIEQSLDPVFFDNKLYVRQSGQSTREYHGEEIDDFVREREELKAERSHALAAFRAENEALAAQSKDSGAEAEANPDKDKPRDADAVKDKENGAVAVGTDSDNAEAPRPIETCSWRPYISYDSSLDDEFVPVGYLYFQGDDAVVFSHQNLWKSVGEDGCKLILAIPEEMSSGSLVLGYEDEKVVKIPMAEIFEAGDKAELHYNADQKLLFAALAGRDDALLCLGADSNGALSRRVIRLSSIDNGHIKDKPRKIHNAPIDHTVLYDIVDKTAVGHFADSMGEKMNKKQFGMILRVKENTEEGREKINAELALCAPAGEL